jgi:hypothetical protein
MNKNVLLISLLLILFLIQKSYSQQSFMKYHYTQSNERSFSIIQDKNDNYVVAGYVGDYNTLVYPIAYKFDKNGNPKDSLILNAFNDNIALFVNSFQIGDYYYFTGISKPNASSTLNKKILFVKTDTSLNVITTKFSTFPNDNSDILLMNTRVDNDTDFIIVGHRVRMTDSRISGFLYKISQNGDSINSRINSFDSVSFYPDLLIDSLNNYYIFKYGSHYLDSNVVIKFDKDLNYITRYKIPELARRAYTPLWVNDSVYTVGSRAMDGIYSNYDRMFVMKADFNGNIIDSVTFGKPHLYNYPASYCRNLAENKKYYFFGGYSAHSIFGSPYGTTKSWLFVAKMDKDLNVKWENYYGYDAYETADMILATNDGGCILLASRDDLYDNLNQLDIMLLKLDSNGTTTWTKTITIPKPKITIFPNPAHTTITLRLAAPGDRPQQLTVYNHLGQSVLQRQTTEELTTLNISHLPAGVYLMEGRTRKGKRFSGRFVKE